MSDEGRRSLTVQEGNVVSLKKYFTGIPRITDRVRPGSSLLAS
jgi:hypothetical protein